MNLADVYLPAALTLGQTSDPDPSGALVLLFAHPQSSVIPAEFRERMAHAQKDRRRWRRFLRRGAVIRGVRYQVVSG